MKPAKYFYLTEKGNAKTKKNDGYVSAELSLAPSDFSGHNVCPHASEGCRNVCLGFFSGRNRFKTPQEAKIRRTKDFFNERDLFLKKIAYDLSKLQLKGIKQGLPVCVRLNCYSDLSWEKFRFEHEGKQVTLFELFPDIQFYDYSKNPHRFNNLPKNYHLTFSRSESNEKDVKYISKYFLDTNIAVVFNVKKGNPLPDIWLGKRVIDGDVTDKRFTDPKGVIVGLRIKGKKDTSGFAVEV